MNEEITHTIRTLLSAGMEPHQVIGEVLQSPEFGGFAERLVTTYVANVQRALTRTKEKRVDEGLRSARTRNDRAQVRRILATEFFPLPDGTTVPWLEATAEQHELRAEWLEGQAAAVLVTAQRHREAAADIRKAKATCLADLDKELAA